MRINKKRRRKVKRQKRVKKRKWKLLNKRLSAIEAVYKPKLIVSVTTGRMTSSQPNLQSIATRNRIAAISQEYLRQHGWQASE